VKNLPIKRSMKSSVKSLMKFNN